MKMWKHRGSVPAARPSRPVQLETNRSTVAWLRVTFEIRQLVTCVYVFMQMCMCVYMYACMYVCMDVWLP